MSTYNKVKGTKWETDLEEYINAAGARCRRLPRSGSRDIGDLSLLIRNDAAIIIEAKNVKNIAGGMADFLRQADVESDNYEDKYGNATVPVVVTKTRQKGTGEARVTMTLNTLLDLLRLVEAI
jgi:hypothetical protein